MKDSLFHYVNSDSAKHCPQKKESRAKQLATAISHEDIASKIFSSSEELQVLALPSIVKSIQSQLREMGKRDAAFTLFKDDDPVDIPNLARRIQERYQH
jgi:hypothetical protein